MKRHPSLQDLSRDHHFVLRLCQRFRRALGAAPKEDLRPLVSEFLAFYRSDMDGHFREEDEFVVPMALERGTAGTRDAAQAVEADHAWLRPKIAALAGLQDAALTDAVRELEVRLTAHVRLEEEQLFEGVQRDLSEPELQALWKRSFAFRQEHRSADACTVRPRSP